MMPLPLGLMTDSPMRGGYRCRWDSTRMPMPRLVTGSQVSGRASWVSVRVPAGWLSSRYLVAAPTFFRTLRQPTFPQTRSDCGLSSAPLPAGRGTRGLPGALPPGSTRPRLGWVPGRPWWGE